MGKGFNLKNDLIYGFTFGDKVEYLYFSHRSEAMITFQDHSHFLAISGVVVCSIAYILPCFAHKNEWIKYMGSALAAELLYLYLALISPDIFDFTYAKAIVTIIGLFCLLLVAFHFAFNITLVGVLFLLVLPWMLHTASDLVKWTHDHTAWNMSPEFGLTLVIVAMVLLWFVVYLLRVSSFLLVGMFLFLVPLMLFIYTRLLWLEYHGTTGVTWGLDPSGRDANDTTIYKNVTLNTIACDFSLGFHIVYDEVDTITTNNTVTNVTTIITTTPIENCPLSIDDYSELSILVGLYLVQLSLLVTFQRERLCFCCCCCKKKKEYRELTVDEEEEEVDELVASSVPLTSPPPPPEAVPV